MFVKEDPTPSEGGHMELPCDVFVLMILGRLLSCNDVPPSRNMLLDCPGRSMSRSRVQLKMLMRVCSRSKSPAALSKLAHVFGASYRLSLAAPKIGKPVASIGQV